MIDYIVLVFACSLISCFIDSEVVNYNTVRNEIKKSMLAKFVFYGILISVILFSSMRTTYNDTTAYLHGFTLVDATNIEFSTLFEPYGGFLLLQQLIHRYLSDDPQMLLFVVSLIVNVSYLSFIRKHTEFFAESILLYLIGTYLFSMAGLKQVISIAISLFAIEGLIEKKYIKFIVLLLLAMTFHPYIICLLILPFLKGKIWDYKVILIVIVGFFLMFNLDRILEFAGMIGKEYSQEEFTGNTINPIRVLVEAVPLLITFVFRRKIRERTDNQYVILGVNMQLLRFAFIFIGLFMNPIYFARMGSYFGQLSCIATPIILHLCFDDIKNGFVWRISYYLFQLTYWLFDLTKIGTISLFNDRFNHISFTEFVQIFK